MTRLRANGWALERTTMQVETFEIEEIAGTTDEERAEAVALADKCGLLAQSAMWANKERPIPFPFLTREQHVVYRLCFPNEKPLGTYSETIPPRAIRAIDIAVGAGMKTENMIVWSAKIGVTDPVLVCKTKEPGGWRDAFYLIARWGDALEPFSALRARAVASLREGVSQVEGELARWKHLLDGGAIESFEPGCRPSASSSTAWMYA